MQFLLHALLISTFAFEQVFAAKKDPPLVPIEDPFYLPPDDDSWKNSTGEVLRKREVIVANVITGTKSNAKAYQLLYSTKDMDGNPDASVTTVIVPVRPNKKRVISLQSAYDSPDTNCAPSYGLQHQAEGWGKTMNRLNLAFLTPYLIAGPILNIPDYEGSNAAFAVGPQSGYQTLDSIKAALSLESREYTGIEEEAKVIMVGYSGGALATEWATEMKAWYAESLPIIGAVIGGAPTNITSTYHNVNGETLAGLNVWAMLGIMNAYPNMNEWMREDLRTDSYQDKRFLLELTSCSYGSPALAQGLQFANISAMFKHGDHFLTEFSGILDTIGVMGQNITEQNNPGYPLAFFYGTEDEVTYPLEDTQKLIARWKTEGKVEKVSDWPLDGKDHTTALFPGMVKAFGWMQCHFKEVEEGDDGHCDEESSEDATGYQNQMSFSSSQELR
ncbi:hypothetical protein N7481_011186 [Penicillium waksmanii]|uniref:uncharacterized protein n=1 Tax=Penicillium waksmanii TaxID=69791 RepID=UPI00254667AA|nr:uncharacterized protein N7481_011186 [Penicillium waksmanii]KAJ5973976.1 hypothetical protein N7481_011186 [Penicillium waksmanii]